MYLCKIAVGLSAFVLLSTGAQARSVLDLPKPPAQHQEQASRSGSIGHAPVRWRAVHVVSCLAAVKTLAAVSL